MPRALKFEAIMDVQDLRRKLGQIEKDVGEVNGRLGSVGGALKAAFGAAAVRQVISVGAELFNLGAQADALRARFDTVFGESRRVVREWADEQNERFGISESRMEGLLSAIGDLLVPMGYARDEAASMAQEIGTLANALSEWTGGSINAQDASIRLTKAMLGERDGLVELGVKLSENDLKARLAAKGQAELEGEARRQAEAMATLEIVTERSTDALTRYRAGGTEAVGTSKRFAATMEDLKEKVAATVIRLGPLIEKVLDLMELLGPSKGLADLNAQTDELLARLYRVPEALQGALEIEIAKGNFEEAENIIATFELVDSTLAGITTRVQGALDAAIEEMTGLPEVSEATVEALRKLQTEGIEGVDPTALGQALLRLGVDAETAKGNILNEFSLLAAELPGQIDRVVADIVDIWSGLPDDFTENQFDVQDAIANALETTAVAADFERNMGLLAEAGLGNIVTALASNPNRAQAIEAARELAQDLEAAAELEKAMGGEVTDALTAMAAQVRESSEASQLATAWRILGARHRREYEAGLLTDTGSLGETVFDRLRAWAERGDELPN